VYNPYLENLPRRSSRTTEFKIYDVDGAPDGDVGAAGMRAGMITSAGRHRESGHNDKFYEEQEYERRVTRRRARVTVAAEEAFGHIKRLHQEAGDCLIFLF